MNPIRRPSTHSQRPPAQKNAARPYDRLSQLPRLIGLWPSEMQDYSAAGTLKILALLRKALRSERSRGRSGHWTYDLNRHLALAESLKAERTHLRALDCAPGASPRTGRNASAPRLEKVLHLPAAATESRHGMVLLEMSGGLPCADQPVFLWPILAESSS